MKFGKVVFLLICVLLTSLVFSQGGSPQQILAAEMTLEPSGEGIDSNAILTQRMIDRRNLSTITGNARVLPQAQFWIWSTKITVWKNFVDVDIFLGNFFITISFVPPYQYCKDFKIYSLWWNDTTDGYYTWSYPSGSCG